MINIEGLKVAKVLMALYNASRPQGMGFLNYDPKPMSEVEAEELLNQSSYFDYLNGRVMKVDLSSEKEFEERLYDRDNGQGAAALVVEQLRTVGTTEKGIIGFIHDVGKLDAAEQAKKMAGSQSKIERDADGGVTLTLGAGDVGSQLTEAVDRALGSTLKLTASRVQELILDCLFKDEEVTKPGQLPENGVLVKGIVQNFGFHKERLESHREEVRELLAELPDEFMVGKGGGWSFLNACMDRHGRQWGAHRDMEALFVLGIGLGFVKYAISDPKSWAVFPGGVPYILVDLQEQLQS